MVAVSLKNTQVFGGGVVLVGCVGGVVGGVWWVGVGGGGGGLYFPLDFKNIVLIVTVFRLIREYFTHIETLPLTVKGSARRF